MDAQVLLILILSFVTFDFILEQILDFLNLRHQKKEIPDDLKGIYEEEKYQQSLAYQKENTKLSFVTSTLSFLLTFTLLATGGFGYIDTLLRNNIGNSDLLPLVYFGALFLASDLLNTPFQWYHTFVIEEKFGFNKTTPKLFIIDKLKGYLIAFIIGGGTVMDPDHIAQSVGRGFLDLLFVGYNSLHVIYEHVLYNFDFTFI